VIFAAPLKHFGRATFIGQETGEPLIFFGENYYFDLPNSKLEAQVSHKKFVLVGARDERRGIVPDFVADQGQDALEVALTVLSVEYAGSQGESVARNVPELLARFDALVNQLLFDPRLIDQPEWAAFRDAFGTAAVEAKNDRQLLAAFDDSLAAHPVFSHFKLRFQADPPESPAFTASSPRPVSFAPLSGQEGLLTIRSFSGDTVMADINQAFDEAIAAGIEKLWVDLRGNPGGTFAAWPLVARVASEPASVGYLVAGKWYQAHDSAPTSADVARAAPTTTPDLQALREDLMDDGLLVLMVEPRAPRFTGEVLVLIDRQSASTSEIIAATLRFNDLATVVGENSAGEVLNAEPVPLDDGVTLLLPIADFYLPDGTRLEGRGVVPRSLTPAEAARINASGAFSDP
jgi:hypothetical protein